MRTNPRRPTFYSTPERAENSVAEASLLERKRHEMEEDGRRERQRELTAYADAAEREQIQRLIDEDPGVQELKADVSLLRSRVALLESRLKRLGDDTQERPREAVANETAG
jgi:hypothetical protein